ncbi:MAG: leucine-rich repeat protein [Clostridiales bacterium]|nr:leucine-rich repeat protein [Clostridiales bacterium]
MKIKRVVALLLFVCLLSGSLFFSAGPLNAESLADAQETGTPAETGQKAAAASSPHGAVFAGGGPPAVVSGNKTGVLFRNDGGSVVPDGMGAMHSTVAAITAVYLVVGSNPLLVNTQGSFTIRAEGGDGEYRYRAVLYYNQDAATEWFESMKDFPFTASPVITHTFDQPGYYMFHLYIIDSSGAQMTWGAEKFLVTTAADYKDPQKVAGKVASLASQCNAAASGPYAKAKWMHDWLTRNANYDETYTIYKPEGVLLLGSGVCDSYARAYQMLLKAVGVPCLYVSSVAGNHAWNLVQLGGNWYHVDVTWDDPVGGGQENHRYFLISDDRIREIGGSTHAAWNDSAGQVPACPYSWGEAPASAPTPAPTAPVNPNPGTFVANHVKYILLDGDLLVEGVDSYYISELVIPATVNGQPVKGIMAQAFAPNPVKMFGSVRLPQGLQHIGAGAFRSVHVEGSIAIPGTVTSIGEGAFNGALLPGTMTIPASVTRIGTGIFADARGLSEIRVDAGNPAYKSQDGVLYSSDMSKLIQYPADKAGSSYRLPDSVNYLAKDSFVGVTQLKQIISENPLLDGDIYAVAHTGVAVHGLRDTPLHQLFKQYKNPPTYVVIGEQPSPILLGDADNNGVVNEQDMVCVIAYIISGVACKNMANANADGYPGVDTGDLMAIVDIIVNQR